MRINTIVLVASLTLSLTSVALAQGVPGGGGSGGNFQSQPDVDLSGRDNRTFDGPANTGSIGRTGPADIGDMIDDDEDAVIGAPNREEFRGSSGRANLKR